METAEETSLQTTDPSAQALSVRAVHSQVQLIQQVMKSEMRDGEHFGKIPGCGDKPALLKAGAEKLCLTFRLAPRHKVEEKDLGNGHREIVTTTELFHIDSGKFLGEGVGSCSTMESKYRYRDQNRKCPKCMAEAIIKGKEEYGGGWVCFKKKGGCGEKFIDGDVTIEAQPVGKIENGDIADTYNTVRKMSKKRSLIDAVLTATAASDIFTQDIDEFPDMAGVGPAAAKGGKPAAAPMQEPRRSSVSDFDPTDAEVVGNGESFDPATGEVFDNPPADFDKGENNAGNPQTAQPPKKALPPKDARRMKSQFSGTKCPGCKNPINKGEGIVKGSGGPNAPWFHDNDRCWR